MSIEYCCECDQATGNAGRMDGSLFAAHQGPFCEDCWGELPGKLAEENEEQATTIALQLARIAELETAVEALINSSTVIKIPSMNPVAANRICTIVSAGRLRDLKTLLGMK
jgi:hypothetical protein